MPVHRVATNRLCGHDSAPSTRAVDVSAASAAVAPHKVPYMTSLDPLALQPSLERNIPA